MGSRALAEAFSSALPSADWPAPQLQSALATLLEQGRKAWPELAVAGEEFARQVARAVDPTSSWEQLTSMQAEDFYLAVACARGEPRAVAELDRRLKGPVARAVARIDDSPDFVDDVLQRLRHKLLVVGDGKIRAYRGTGPLLAWLRAIAVRLALRVKARSGSSAVVGDGPLMESLAARAPDTALLWSRHRGAFQAAFEQAFASLEPRERNVLRLQVIEGLSIDEIGALYRVHRATSARWLQAARERLYRRARQNAAKELKVDQDELRSLLRAVQSELDVSIRRVVAGPADGGREGQGR